MAVAAAAYERDLFETEQPLANYERAPESEVYGRSLSTAYRLGALAVEISASEAAFSPEAEQVKKEFYTSVEEGLGTDAEHGKELVVRDFDERPVINGRWMAKDLKTAVADMTEAGLICAKDKLAKESAEGDMSFAPQLTRSYWDHENALIVDEMSQGKTEYNTRIVVTPYPEEAAAESGDEYWRDIGYVPHIKRGFVQLYFVDNEGAMAGSLSFNGSDKRHLQEVFKRRGIDIPDEETTDNWLQYAITDTLSLEEAKQLATEIADEADTSEHTKIANTVETTSEQRHIMEAAFDESYVHATESLRRGLQTEGLRKQIMEFADNAQHFNDRYQKALYGMRANQSKFSDDDFSVMHELLVYSTIEALRAHHLKSHDTKQSGSHSSSGMSQNYVPTGEIHKMLSNFGAEGARSKRVYSACGLAISLGNNKEGTMDTSGMPQRAFGGYDQDIDNEESRVGRKSKARCKVEGCPTNPREVIVGGCGVCIDNCQKMFDAGKDPTKMYTLRKDIGNKTTLKSVEFSISKKSQESITSPKLSKEKFKIGITSKDTSSAKNSL